MAAGDGCVRVISRILVKHTWKCWFASLLVIFACTGYLGWRTSEGTASVFSEAGQFDWSVQDSKTMKHRDAFADAEEQSANNKPSNVTRRRRLAETDVEDPRSQQSGADMRTGKGLGRWYCLHRGARVGC